MRRRRRMTRKKSRRLFSKTGRRVHKKNLSYQANPMRGGYRL